MNSAPSTDRAMAPPRPPSSGTDGPYVACEGVWLGYGDEIVLREVHLDVPPGRWIWLVGPNGAGKSTLLRALVGLLRPRRGRIHRTAAARPVGYAPQQHTLDVFFPMSVRAIVEMGLFARIGPWRRPSPLMLGEVDHWLDRLGLSGHATKTFAELSGGMRQKALLARAFVTGARWFVFDEATSELDVPSEALVWRELSRRLRDEGCSVLVAHHGTLPEPIAGGDEWIAEVARGEVRCVPREGGSP